MQYDCQDHKRLGKSNYYFSPTFAVALCLLAYLPVCLLACLAACLPAYLSPCQDTIEATVEIETPHCNPINTNPKAPYPTHLGDPPQVVSSPLEVGSALVLATSCAVNGRYLRHLRLVARGSVIREQFPPKLLPALPLSEPLSLLVRLSRMQPGAALELTGVWPNGRLAHMEVSVDPRLRTSGQLLPVLCALRWGQ